MLNAFLCMLFQGAAGPVFGFAMDSMQAIKQNAPPKWVRVGLWCVVFFMSILYNLFWRDTSIAINYVHFGLSILAALVGYRFFYEGGLLRTATIALILTIAGISAELASALQMRILNISRLSCNFTLPDMVLFSLVGAFFSNFAMLFAAILWRRFQLQKRMPRGSGLFALMNLCLLIPTVMFWMEIYENGSTASLFHIFSMAGALVLSLLLICVQFNQVEKDEMEKELSELKHKSELERQHYQSIEIRREELAKIRHDYNNQLSSVLGLLKTSNPQEAEKIIQSLLGKIEETREYPYCSIPIINAILSEKEKECRTNGIKLYPDILLPDNVAIKPIDLCSIFSNLLDNAIRACTHLPTEVIRGIEISCRIQGDYLLIRCANKATKAPGKKPEGSGYGTKILQEIAKQYHGDFQTEFSNGVFTACLILLNLT